VDEDEDEDEESVQSELVTWISSVICDVAYYAVSMVYLEFPNAVQQRALLLGVWWLLIRNNPESSRNRRARDDVRLLSDLPT
jgi:hypothetical protein